VRTISAALEAAQRAPSREPYVSASVENTVGGVRRLDFAQIDANAYATNRHGVAVAGDESVTRVRVESGAIKQQRVTGSGPWTSWNDLATGMGVYVACAAEGARVAVVYVDAAGTTIKIRESTDNGQSYGSAADVTTSPAALTALAVAYKRGTTDLAIAWTTATQLRLIKRTSGSFGSVQLSGETFTSLNGVALAYGFDWDMLVTGAEISSQRPTLWTHIYGDGNDHTANTWGALQAQQQVESDSGITFQAPFLAYLDTYRGTFVEVDGFAGGQTRTFRTYLPLALIEFDSGAFSFRTPAPTDYKGARGLALAGGSTYAYETAPDTVRRAPRSQAFRDLSADVLAIELDESTDRLRGHVDLDNASGAYTAAQTPPVAIAVGNLVVLRWGYRTSSGNQSSQAADMEVAAIETRRRHGASVVRLVLAGGFDVLRRNRQRHQVVHSTDTYRTIISRILARAGYSLTFVSASSRSSSVTPAFTIHPQTSGYEALRQALALLADRVVMRANAAAIMTEPLASESADYTFDGPHQLRDILLRTELSGPSEAQVFGASVYGEALTVAEAEQYQGAHVQVPTSRQTPPPRRTPPPPPICGSGSSTGTPASSSCRRTSGSSPWTLSPSPTQSSPGRRRGVSPASVGATTGAATSTSSGSRWRRDD
jgi:hypothetical protein